MSDHRILTVGTFDLFHHGHMRFLQACAGLGTLAVGVNTDEFAASFKLKPIMRYDERATVIEGVAGVSMVLKHDGAGANIRSLLHVSRANILAIGSDWATKDYYGQIGIPRDQLAELRVQLVYLPYSPEISSTTIRDRLRG